MSVDTKIKIAKTSDIFRMVRKIENVIKEKLPLFGEIDVDFTHPAIKGDKYSNYDSYFIYFALDYPCENYESGKEQRQIYVYYDYDTNSELIRLSIGCWGHNEDIAKCLVDAFGGYADFNDCDSITIDYAMPQPKN